VITVTFLILLGYFPTETVQPSINQSDPKENDLTPASDDPDAIAEKTASFSLRAHESPRHCPACDAGKPIFPSSPGFSP